MNGADQRRLERYELFADRVRAELRDTRAQMESLRAEGRTHTATYQQLFANKAQLEDIITRLHDAGL